MIRTLLNGEETYVFEYGETIAYAEKQITLLVLRKNKGHRDKTAQDLGICRRTLTNWLKRYALKTLSTRTH